MEIAMQQINMNLHRKLDRIRNRLTGVRHSLESIPLLIYPDSGINPNDIIDNIVAFHTAIVYLTFTIEAAATELRDLYEDNPETGVNSLVQDIRTTTTALESVWNLRPKGTVNEDTAKVLKKQLKAISNNIVEAIEKISTTSHADVERAFKEVSLNKPKFRGKGKYIENLGDLMIEIVKDSNKNEMNLIEIRNLMLKRYSTITLAISDMEQAAKALYQNKLVQAIRKDGNSQIIQLHTTNSSPKCTKCGKERGYLLDFYRCDSSNGYVCTEDISFFGKCKLCSQKISQGHELVR